MTKGEFYKTIIDVQKKSGQGLSGIVKAMGVDSASFSRYLDEFIEEGLIKACHTGGSIGHPESNIFYMPTKGYNVWEDEDSNEYSRHKGRYLQFVRFYLGALQTESENKFEPSMSSFIKNPEVMEEYTKWLKRNQKELEVMTSLDDFYADDVEFSEDEVKWVKSRGWYEKNETIDKCYVESKLGVYEDDEVISLNKQLIKLYTRSIELGETSYKSDLKDAEDDITKTEKTITTRRKLHNWFETQDKKVKIQDCFNYV